MNNTPLAHMHILVRQPALIVLIHLTLVTRHSGQTFFFSLNRTVFFPPTVIQRMMTAYEYCLLSLSAPDTQK